MASIKAVDAEKQELFIAKFDEEDQRKGIFIQRANDKNQGKFNANEADMCERFIHNYKDRAFFYLVAYEWDHVEGMSNLGAGDLVFSSNRDLSAPCEVLVIEAKYLDLDWSGSIGKPRKNHRDKVRKQIHKVQKQVWSSMDAWKRLHSSHTVYGAILMNKPVSDLGSNPPITMGIYLSNKISLIAEIIPHEEEFCVPPPPPKLRFYPPLPKVMWGDEYKPSMDITLWEQIKTERFTHQENTCEMCRSVCRREDLVLHQQWKYNNNDDDEDIDDAKDDKDIENMNEMVVRFYRFEMS